MSTNGNVSADELIANLHLFTYLTHYNMEEKFIDHVTENQISFLQMNLMRILGLHSGLTVGEVARFMNVSYPAATKTIDKLVRLGYLKRKEDGKDRRIAHLLLTSHGQKLVDKYTTYKDEQMAKVLQHFRDDILNEINDRLLDLSRVIVDELKVSSANCMHCGAFDPSFCHTAGKDECGYLVKQGKIKKA
jgi:DNA-binding MarR family transcriptional regulator